MRRIEQLITRVRRETENEEFGDSYGIADNEFIDYLNDAQDRMYAEIIKTHPKFFLQETIVSTANQTEVVTLPARIYLGQISMVEWSTTNQPEDYYVLRQAMLKERISDTIGNPIYYIRRNKEILLAPVPNNGAGNLRINYAEKLPRLDKRRGKISSVTTSGSSITSLILDTAETIDRDEILDEQYICVVDKYGAQKMAAIPVTDISTSTGTVTIDAGFTFESGESIAADDYVVSGEFSTNRSEMQDIVERYLVSHLRMEILDRDSNAEGTASQVAKVTALLNEIVESFRDNNDDVFEPPILVADYIVDDEFHGG
jgi:hypothetical protein